MAAAPTIHLGENSPEHIAYLLLRAIASNEGKELASSPVSGAASADKKWILDTYAECLVAVRKPESRLKSGAISSRGVAKEPPR
jgi:hypothetical protein